MIKTRWNNFITIFCLLFGIQTWAASQSNADDFSARAFLEEIMTRRYSQGLGTLLKNDGFTVGVQVELKDAPPKKDPAKPNEPGVETPMDLMVGNLDTEKLIKQFALETDKPALVSYLSTKKVKSILISVGLHESLGDTVKSDVAKWLKTRVQKEFGSIGKTEVNYLKVLPPNATADADKKNPEKEKTKEKYEWWEWLDKFQTFAGISLFAFTLLLGVLIWRMTTSKSLLNQPGAGDPVQVKVSSAAEGVKASSPSSETESNKKTIESEQISSPVEEAFVLTQKINGLVAKIAPSMEKMIQTWANEGDAGQFKIVCFADAIGKEIGRLPIPSDLIPTLAKIFLKMPKVEVEKKKEILESIYWDMVAVINLGTEALQQPFNYLGGADSSAINQILLNKNPKLKMLVSQFLPGDVRKKFLSGLTEDAKVEVLRNAAIFNEIRRSELNEADSLIKSEMGTGKAVDSVTLESSFENVLSALTRTEEIQLLSKLSNEELASFKRKAASIAFFHEWPDASLAIALGKLRPDTIVSYLKFKPDQYDRVIKLCSEMTAEVVSDDYKTVDGKSAAELELQMENLSTTLRTLVEQKAIDLEQIFPAPTSKASLSEVKSA